ncbi:MULTISPECIES: aminotransferase class IV [unclassified Brevundimonas]|uniref:aminotransferase class IV n=1 Tax=unclassified Brevundimonas TaxID=2622653 RepID=UPI0025BAF333|nr:MULTISPECIES: aminotransferase class IV [unclassified Brevundimonas]
MAVEPQVWIDGHPATFDDMRQMAAVNYGVVTSFAYADGGVRGLDLHMERLAVSCRELFSCELEKEPLLNALKHSLENMDQAWVRITLADRMLSVRAPERPSSVATAVWIAPPATMLDDGMRLRSIVHQRELAHLKHLGMTGVIHARRGARMAGFDDALLVDGSGGILEGTLWNVGFIDASTVIWPRGDILDGVTRRLIARGLEKRGITQRTQRVTLEDLERFQGAFLCNAATPAASISSIDGHRFTGNPAMMQAIRAAWQDQPVQLL